MRYVVLLLAIALAGALGYIVREFREAPDIESRATEVQDQVRRIAKFATAEGNYSRMVRYNDPGYTTWFSGTDKTVLVQAKVRVLMGFDLEGVQVDVDRATKQLVVRGWPPPEQLAFELDTDYFDVREGMFVDLDAKDLNKIRGKVRALMEKQVDREALRRESYTQAEELLDIVRSSLTDSGWSLRVEGWPEDSVQRKPG